ncbi:MAG TPA: hypothetical protein PKM27_04355 [Saprospiraceae bacterium]|nr:hypothetical protein [Saprospiraceae bacterium]HNT21959.1 hypothetical protein [Saprospiraceae bacterium]
MKVIFRSLVFLILAGVLAFPFVRIMYIHLRVVSHRKIMQGEEMGDHPVETLNLTVAELNRFRLDERELIYEGKRYDIRTEKRRGDSVRLFAVHDWYEQYLLQEIIDLHEKGKQPDQQVARMLTPDWIIVKILRLNGPNKPAHPLPFPEYLIRWMHTPWLTWFPPPDGNI